jgi:hypothetical protein
MKESWWPDLKRKGKPRIELYQKWHDLFIKQNTTSEISLSMSNALNVIWKNTVVIRKYSTIFIRFLSLTRLKIPLSPVLQVLFQLDSTCSEVLQHCCLIVLSIHLVECYELQKWKKKIRNLETKCNNEKWELLNKDGLKPLISKGIATNICTSGKHMHKKCVNI